MASARSVCRYPASPQMNFPRTNAMKRYFFKTVASPVGELKLVASDAGLAAILWENDSAGRVPLGPMTRDGDHPVLCEAERQLAEYFAGRRRSFDLELDFAGTGFQRKVWAALLT